MVSGSRVLSAISPFEGPSDYDISESDLDIICCTFTETGIRRSLMDYLRQSKGFILIQDGAESYSNISYPSQPDKYTFADNKEKVRTLNISAVEESEVGVHWFDLDIVVNSYTVYMATLSLHIWDIHCILNKRMSLARECFEKRVRDRSCVRMNLDRTGRAHCVGYRRMCTCDPMEERSKGTGLKVKNRVHTYALRGYTYLIPDIDSEEAKESYYKIPHIEHWDHVAVMAERLKYGHWYGVGLGYFMSPEVSGLCYDRSCRKMSPCITYGF